MRYIHFLVALSFLVVLAACGGAPTGGALPTVPAPATAVPAPPPTAQPTAAPAPAATAQPAGNTATSVPVPGGVLVVYHKSGGIAGIDQTLTIYADGRVVLKSRSGGEKTAEIGGPEIDTLLRLLTSSEFATLQPSVQIPGADQMTYEIKVPGVATISTMDGAENPKILDEIVQALEQISRELQ